MPQNPTEIHTRVRACAHARTRTRTHTYTQLGSHFTNMWGSKEFKHAIGNYFIQII